MIGVMVTKIEELIGVESSKPLKKESILILAPSMAAVIRGFQSCLAIFSDFTNMELIQNSSAAPPVLRKIKPNAPT